MKNIPIPSSRCAPLSSLSGFKKRDSMSTQTRATRSGSFFTTVFLTSLLAGCSTAVYETEIKSFKSSTDSAINAMKNYAAETAKVNGQNKLRKMLLKCRRGPSIIN